MKGELKIPQSEQVRMVAVKLLTGLNCAPNIQFCEDCNTVFEVKLDGKIRCNGTIIQLCPWCRPDTRPWQYGRGD